MWVDWGGSCRVMIVVVVVEEVTGVVVVGVVIFRSGEVGRSVIGEGCTQCCE